jgi:hypothetical protein
MKTSNSSNLTVIDTAALNAELENEHTEKVFAVCRALNALRHAIWDRASKKDIARLERAYREAIKQRDAAEVAAYGAKETARRNRERVNLVEAIERADKKWKKSPEFKKECADANNILKHGARQTKHTGFTVIDNKTKSR